MKKYKTIKKLLCVFVAIGLFPLHAQAEISTDQMFESAEWTLLFEDAREAGVVQSMCLTEDYIISLENYDDSTQNNDILKAYYRNDTDEAGNPVERFSLAKRINSMHYEHCNGLAYNPNTKEIIISLYTNLIPENRGSLYVLDSESLEYVRTVKVSDDYNVLGIDYVEESDQYVIQTNVEGGYSFKILNSAFEIVEDLGEFESTNVGNNFQDLCVSGDYIITFPLTLGLEIGDYISAYSISRKELVSATPVNFPFQGVLADEPEGICEAAPGVFWIAVNTELEDGSSKTQFYETAVPYDFTVTTVIAKDEEKTEETKVVSRGENLSFQYIPEKGYEVAKVSVDEKDVDLEKNEEKYSVDNIQGDHSIEISYTKINHTIRNVLLSIVAVVMVGITLLYLRLRQLRAIRRRKKAAARRRRERERKRALEQRGIFE